MVIPSYTYCIFLFLFADSSLALWQEKETIIFWIVLVFLFVSGLIICLVYFFKLILKQRYEYKLNQQKIKYEHSLNLKEATLTCLEEERKRFASDLHDGLIGKITAIRYGLEIQIPLIQIDNMLEECINDSRRISHNLFPPFLKESTLQEMIQQCIYLYKTGYKINYHTDIRQEVNLTEDKKLHILRILQELMANTCKHANATEINITLKITHEIILLFSDNGTLRPVLKKRGLGLDSINNRVTQLKGKMKLYPSYHGFRTLIVIPQ